MVLDSVKKLKLKSCKVLLEKKLGKVSAPGWVDSSIVVRSFLIPPRGLTTPTRLGFEDSPVLMVLSKIKSFSFCHQISPNKTERRQGIV